MEPYACHNCHHAHAYVYCPECGEMRPNSEGREPVRNHIAGSLWATLHQLREEQVYAAADHIIQRLVQGGYAIGRTPPTEDREPRKIQPSHATGRVSPEDADEAARKVKKAKARRPIGYVEESELPIRGRATLHETPDPSRRAVYVEREETKRILDDARNRGVPKRGPTPFKDAVSEVQSEQRSQGET